MNQLEKDLKDSTEFDRIKNLVGPELEKLIFDLCKYAYSMGEAQGYFEATGEWEY